MKASELIKELQELKNIYGDLETTLHCAIFKENCKINDVLRYNDIFVAIDKYDEELSKIDIRTFPY